MKGNIIQVSLKCYGNIFIIEFVYGVGEGFIEMIIELGFSGWLGSEGRRVFVY